MADVLPYLPAAAALAAVMAFLAWVARPARRRSAVGAGVAGALARPTREAHRVTAHESRYELKAQAERQIPVLSPDHLWTSDPGGNHPAGRGRPAACDPAPWPAARVCARPVPARLRRGRG